MKRRIPRIALIYKQGEKGRASEGGVTLETALVMPIFLMLVLFLVFMVQIAVISMALHGALSQTVRQASAAWYPISLGIDQVRNTPINGHIEELNEKWLGVRDTVEQYGEWLPSPMKEWAIQATSGTLSLEQHAAQLAFYELLKPFVDKRTLDLSRIRLTSVELPDLKKESAAYLTLKAEYTLPVQVPFTGRRLILAESARERVWIGGSPSQSRLAEENQESFEVTFVSLEPNPVKPGRKATLILRTKPGTAVDLSVIYKSGPSQAKHLGSAVADADGLVSWTWHVSGRTTPGQWDWQVSNGNGGTWQQIFEVAGKRENDTKEGE